MVDGDRSVRRAAANVYSQSNLGGRSNMLHLNSEEGVARNYLKNIFQHQQPKLQRKRSINSYAWFHLLEIKIKGRFHIRLRTPRINRNRDPVRSK